MANTIFGIANSESQAANIINQLQSVGFSRDDVSVLLSNKEGTTDFAVKHETKAPEGAAAGATTGGLLGGTLGWLVGVGSLAIPGLGPFIAAGPIMAALGGAAVGAAVGGLTGGLIGLGVPEYEAKRYESRLKQGGILISVRVYDDHHKDLAKKIFENAGAEDIAASSAIKVEHEEVRNRG
ncbi:MAG TPA: hypothetical protein VNM87_08910 [Candidatus Udaeobacter sp.]|nr:hypothetical protein [Candidatus Udaeobacter sp.]